MLSKNIKTLLLVMLGLRKQDWLDANLFAITIFLSYRSLPKRSEGSKHIILSELKFKKFILILFNIFISTILF